MRLILLRFWPVLLPILLYLAWLAYARRKAGKENREKPGFTDGPWLWPTASTLLLLIGVFIWLGTSADPVDGTYVPAQLKDGQLIPSRIDPDE